MRNNIEIIVTKYKAPKIELKHISDASSACTSSKNKNSEETFNLMLALFNKETIAIYEELHIAYLNRANIVIGTYMMSKGGTSGTIADIKLITCIAIKTLAFRGNTSSQSSIRLTKAIYRRPFNNKETNRIA